MIGQTISHYRIVEKLGEGGMGVVYKAEDTRLDRTVALKFLAAHLLDDETHKARFLREAKAAAALDHPNIATIHEIDEANGQAFLAMAYIEGPSLDKKIRQRPLKLEEALDIAIQIAQGLHAAHERGIVHRDIKSANILLTPRGEVKITDFGLARFEDRAQLTKSGITLGTPAYMSPEQALGKTVDGRSDIWSLGVVIYEMVTGRLPFAGEVERAVIYSILNQDAEPPTALRTGVPLELDRIVSKALAKEAADRHQHVDDLLVDLRRMRKEFEAAPVPKQAREDRDRAAKEIGVGRRLAHYRLESKLGEGGMGVVYRAHDSHLDRPVAIKILKAATVTSADRTRRFKQEATAASALNHPNIVTIYDISSDDGVEFIAMEYLTGHTLDHLIGRKGLSVGETLRYCVQIADALAKAHEGNIIHRDIKPANIMVTVDGLVKVLDFGLAKLLEPGDEQLAPVDRARKDLKDAETEEGTVLGTVAYMSPEQAEGKPVDPRSDIFSLGSVLSEMLTGRRAFAGETKMSVLAAILREDPEPPGQVVEDLPRELERVIQRCLRKDVRRRFQHMDDLRVALEELKEESAWGSLTRSTRALPRRQSAWSRRTVTAAAGAIAVAAALAVAMWYGTRTRVWENPLAGAQIERLTDFDGVETDAAISRDGKSVSFLSDRDGAVDAWVTRIGTGEFANLTKGRISGLLLPGIRSAGFSHDGAQVWLRVEQDSEGRVVPQGSWYVSVMGGVPRRFLENGVEPEWAPDGIKLAYHEPVGGDPIFVADANGANPRKIFSEQPGGHCHHLTWSLDGRFVYFVRGLPLERTDIWRVSATGGEPERITHHNSDVQYPTLLDAETLLYTATSDDGSGPWLYTLDLQERVPRRVSVGVEQYLSLGGSADGQRLVASVANPNGELWTVPILDRVALEADATKHPMTATRTTGPRFGPDYLLYLSSMGGAHGLWRYQTGESTELWKAMEGGVAGPPAISPDGLVVSFSVRKLGGGGLYTMTPHGTNLRQIDLGKIHDVRGSPSWSPDGKWIAVTAYEGDQRRLFKVPVDGGAPVALVDGSPTSPLWLPDGDLILYRVRQGPSFSLRAVTPDGAAASVPPHLTSASSFDGYRVIPGTQTLISLQGDVPLQNFWFTDLKTGTNRRLTDFKAALRIRSFDISPDGKQILFDRWREDSDIVLIERPRR